MASGNFARGFLSTFGPTVERQDQKRQDAFKMFYNDYIDRRKDKEKYDREDAQKVKLAQELTSRYEVPEGTWTWTYKQLDAGIPVETIANDLQAGKFNVTDMAAGQVNKPTPKVQDQSQEPVNLLQQQTNDAFGNQQSQNNEVGNIQPNIPNQPPEPNPLWRLQDKFRNLFNPKANQEQELNDIILQTSKITGATPEQIKETMRAGYQTPHPEMDRYKVEAPKSGLMTKQKINSLDDAIAAKQDALSRSDQAAAARAQTYIDAYQASGNQEYMQKRKDQITDKLQEPIFKYNTAKTNIMNVVRSAGDMVKIVNQQPGVTNDLIAGGAESIAKWNQAVNTVYDILKDPSDVTALQTAQKKLGSLEEQYTKLEKSSLGKKVLDLATAKRLFEMKAQISAYNLAMAYQQSGNRLSETERKMFEEMLKGGVNPKTFLQNMAVLVNGEISRLEDEGNQNFFKNNSINQFNKQNPDSPYELDITSIRDDIKNDATLNSAMQGLDQFNNLDVGIGTQEDQTNGPAIGSVEDGYRFKGGDPSKPENWEQVK